jgi:hypothetical protein
MNTHTDLAVAAILTAESLLSDAHFDSAIDSARLGFRQLLAAAEAQEDRTERDNAEALFEAFIAQAVGDDR